MRSLRGVVLLVCLSASHPAGPAFPSTQVLSRRLLGDFERGWDDHWIEMTFDTRPTRHRVVREDGNTVLMAESEMAASALWCVLDVHPGDSARISWRWKVSRSLTENTREREKRGDDYAARLLVFFGPRLFGAGSRAISYVWAGNEPRESTYRSPYSSRIGTVVLESGDRRAGRWVSEERDVVADYRTIFDRSPKMVAAVALMVDTDNTGLEAVAWFDDIVFERPGPVRER